LQQAKLQHPETTAECLLAVLLVPTATKEHSDTLLLQPLPIKEKSPAIEFDEPCKIIEFSVPEHTELHNPPKTVEQLPKALFKIPLSTELLQPVTQF
jgi:hypothetical protein